MARIPERKTETKAGPPQAVALLLDRAGLGVEPSPDGFLAVRLKPKTPALVSKRPRWRSR